VDLVTGSVDAPWGPIRLAASARGLVAIDQLVAEADFVERLRRRFGSPRITSAGEGDPDAARHLHDAASAVRAWLDGDVAALRAIEVDLADRPAWDRQVLEAVRGIAPGTTASYGGVARMIGRPGAARAVGGAVGRNPVGLAIPCHRVIAGDGSLGGYGGGTWGGREAGLELKRQLLAREGVRIPGSPHR
jgi:methylated-DNA-[protein]-cysteine S-methyltransferase